MMAPITDPTQLRRVHETDIEGSKLSTLLDGFQRNTSSFSSTWSGQAFGVRPRWWSKDLTVPGDPLVLVDLRSAYYVPSMGAVITQSGEVPETTVRHASYVDPDLERLRKIWDARADAPGLVSGIVTMSWGAVHNYGHFLLDALTSAAALSGRTAFREYEFLVPPLNDWQRQHFGILGLTPTELQKPIYFVDKILFTSGIKGALHNPNTHFQELREASLLRHPSTSGRSSKIYVSRRGHKRTFIKEPLLEQELSARGFSVVRPEAKPVSEQIEIFHAADIVVAPTGAALANMLFMKSGAKVVEIIPRDMTLSDTAHKWVAYLVAMGGGDWRPFFCENVGDEERQEVGGQKRSGFLPFDLDVDDLIAFIESK